ncbi:MAG: prephenate dehydrogenase, partial [Armatimonadetes bacterium]|nr:prephenate dehydrogenase [Armatimonadota bacterium]
KDHDRVAGYLSHLPHAMAYALASSAREALEPDSCALAGGSFRSATRVARSDPEVWASILLDNAENVSHALEHFSVRLEAIRQAVVSGDEHAVVRLLALGHSTERPGA